MGRGCTEGQYWDGLVRQCMSCRMVCGKAHPHPRCLGPCVVYDCKSVAGQFYDALLKKCLKCSELCGHHPAECSSECLGHKAAKATSKPATTMQPLATRGSSVARGLPSSEVLVYALLGLAFAILVSTVLLALLALLRRARQQRECGEKCGQTDGHRQPSKDWLMAEALTQEAGMVADRPRAIETCAHCFSEQAEATYTFYQQAVPQPLHGERRHADEMIRSHAARVAGEAGEALRIICSPTQTSM
ncbi:tumor necrosis factor receptor superfamily member 13B [Brachyhypopomus gauderio]|uniref:tumor necrosis factor receptor superfamily member 13B n=1 Tax=Brachyhypopomus gauderio TaxID=698409 RepID=UPI004041EB87